MSVSINKRRALEKIAYGIDPTPWNPTVGYSNPPPNVSNVLSAIGVAQARGIGTPGERRDAFGRIINSGLVNTSPAGNALRMLGGGILGRAITGAFTNNSFLRGLGTGFGAVSAISKW
jgi:hypothetical protein